MWFEHCAAGGKDCLVGSGGRVDSKTLMSRPNFENTSHPAIQIPSVRLGVRTKQKKKMTKWKQWQTPSHGLKGNNNVTCNRLQIPVPPEVLALSHQSEIK